MLCAPFAYACNIHEIKPMNGTRIRLKKKMKIIFLYAAVCKIQIIACTVCTLPHTGVGLYKDSGCVV